jgi:uncharacterized protein with GYD domain
MKYVLLGKIDPQWIRKSERFTKSKEKAEKLGITIETVHYTQGPYDFVDIVSAKDPQAVVAFSVWYAAQGYGSITTMPGFTPEEFSRAIEKV